MNRYLWEEQLRDGSVIDVSEIASRIGFISTIAMTRECMLELTGLDHFIPKSKEEPPELLSESIRRIEECLFTLYAVSSICRAGRLQSFFVYLEGARLMELCVHAGFGDYMEPIMLIDLKRIIKLTI